MQSNITATIQWHRGEAPFTDNRYSRLHAWRFDGGVELPASSSPDIVPVPMSDASAVDPEEALVASLSSCHMLWFLSIAAQKGFVVDEYLDQAVGQLGHNAAGKLVMTKVTLRPLIRWSGSRQPTAAQIGEMHQLAHDECFIANSVKSEVCVEPVLS